MKRLVSITVIIAVGLIALWFLALISPLMEKDKEAESGIVQSEQKLKEMQSTLLRFPEQYRIEREMMMKKKELVAQLYSKEDLIKLFDNFRAKAQTRRLALLEITPSVEELLEMNRRAARDGQPQELNLSIRLSGDLRGLGEFVKDIESEQFYQGTNFCKITGTAGGKAYPEMSYGFKAILGTLEKT